MTQLLVVSPDKSWNEALGLELEPAGFKTLGLRTGDEAVAVLKMLGGQFGGIVIGATPGAGQSECDAATGADDLVSAIRRDANDIPILLWSRYPTERLSRIVGRDKRSAVLQRDTADSITETLRCLSAPIRIPEQAATNAPAAGRVELEIGAANIRVTMTAPGKVIEVLNEPWTGRQRLLKLEQKFRKWELRRRTGNEPPRYADDWDQIFKETGEDLAEALFYTANKLREALAECLAKVHTLDKIHFRFSLMTDSPDAPNPFIHIPFELLYDTAKEEFIRSLAPVARRICLNEESRTATPLASAQSLSGPVLFVKSDAHGSHVLPGTTFAGKTKLVLSELAELDAEYEGARAARAGARIPCPAPELVSLESGEDAVTKLRDTMVAGSERTPPAQILHFAGHSVRADDGSVFLILPGEAPGQLTPLPIGEFARWARQCELRLVLLSSCQSSSPEAIFRLAQAGVPAVIGFRWEVDDTEAAFFTRSLHRELANNVTLARAFHRAVCAVRIKYPTSPTFASPMLVVQDEEWTT